MNNIYADAEEKYVKNVVLYANASKLYTDEGHAEQVAFDDALNLCLKGNLLIFDTDTYYPVAAFKDDEGSLTVTYGTGSTPKTATVSTAPLG